MTVQSCKIYEQPTGQYTQKFAATYKGRFRVVTNDADDGPLAVVVGAQSVGPDNLPDKWDTYRFPMTGTATEEDLSSYALGFDVKPIDGKRTHWDVDVTWRPPDLGEEPGQDVQAPLSRPAVSWLEFEEDSHIVEQATNLTALPGRLANTFGPLENAARKPFDTPLEDIRGIPVLVAEKNYASLSAVLSVHATYYNTTNNAPYLGAGTGTLWFRRISCSPPQFENGTLFYRGTIRLAYNPLGWDQPLVNRGLGHLETANDPTSYTDTIGNKRITEPVKLELDGTLTPEGNIGTTITYRLKGQANFTGLGL